MGSKNTLEPKIILTIDIHSHINIPFIVTTATNKILTMTHCDKLKSNYKTRQNCIAKIEQLRQQYNIDTIILEQNKLFIDKIDRHPDPIVLRNILWGFGVKITIDDTYHKLVENIIELPNWEWSNKVLNSTVKYSIDLYKAHVMSREDISKEYLDIIEQNNYYKAVCLSESVLWDTLMNKKYLINKGDK